MRDYSTEVEHFEREGYVIARGVLTPDDLAPLIGDLSRFIDRRANELHQEGKIRDLHESLGFDRRVVQLYHADKGILDGMDIMFLRDRATFDFLHNDNLLDLAETLIGPEISCNPIQHFRAKIPMRVESDSGFMNVPWHQDVGVTQEESDASTIHTFWLPLTDATVETGCMQILPRCVEIGALPHVAGGYGTEIDPDLLPDRKPVDLECVPGDVVVMSKYTPHLGLPNRSNRSRWSVDLRYHVTGHHSGRDWLPEFPVRSADPASVRRDYAGWCEAWKAGLADKTPHRGHRVTAKTASITPAK